MREQDKSGRAVIGCYVMRPSWSINKAGKNLLCVVKLKLVVCRGTETQRKRNMNDIMNLRF